MLLNPLLLGGLMALTGAITAWTSRNFPTMPGQDYGAGTFPMLIGIMLAVLGTLLALRGMRQREPLFAWHGAVSASRVWLCLAAVCASVAIYALVTPILGFAIVVPVIIALLIAWLSQGRWLLAVMTALISSLLVWLIFSELLHVPLPLGVLEEVVY
ncbi:tripartite tricarboxylate transporter TctB family protein [Halomonas nitroreducens]|nr:tripartite tricarboxylate transporter TctB family protein [Halomonas nitroreducens]